MNPVGIGIGTVAVIVWFIALFGFIRVAIAWLGVMKAAPAGQRFATFMELGFWNFPAVEQRLGPTAAPLVHGYKQGFLLFFGAVFGFMILTILNIVLGQAA